MESCAKKMASCADFAPIFYVIVDEEECAVESVEAVNECVQVEKALYAHGDDDEGNASTALVHIDVGQVVNGNPIFVPDEPEKIEISLLQMENTNPNETAGGRSLKEDIITGSFRLPLRNHLPAPQPSTITGCTNGPIDDHSFNAAMASIQTAQIEELNMEKHCFVEEKEEVDEIGYCFGAENVYITDEDLDGNNILNSSILKGQRLKMLQDTKRNLYATYGGTSIASQSKFDLYSLPFYAHWRAIPRSGEITACSRIGGPSSPHILCETEEYGSCVFKGAEIATIEQYQSFEQELATGMTLRHQNLLVTYGPVLDDNGTYFAGMLNEHIPFGSLETFINNFGHSMDLEAKQCMILHVAGGMDYLHSIGLVHNNLKPSTILLCEISPGVLTAKISNFSKTRGLVDGLTGVSDNSIVLNKFYSDPTLEWNPEGATYSKSSDVYSLGMVMLQVMAGEIRLPNGQLFLNCVNGALINPFTMFHPTGVPDNWWKLISSCLSLKPSERPSVRQVLQTIASFE